LLWGVSEIVGGYYPVIPPRGYWELYQLDFLPEWLLAVGLKRLGADGKLSGKSIAPIVAV